METSFSVTEDRAIIRLNPLVYSLDMAYATAYPFLDRVWILFDGDPASEIIITLIRKTSSMDMEKFAKDFLNELVSVTNYFKQFEINRDVINAVLQRALFSASPQTAADAADAKTTSSTEEKTNAD